jgi:hypothetical protein
MATAVGTPDRSVAGDAPEANARAATAQRQSNVEMNPHRNRTKETT